MVPEYIFIPYKVKADFCINSPPLKALAVHITSEAAHGEYFRHFTGIERAVQCRAMLGIIKALTIYHTIMIIIITQMTIIITKMTLIIE